MNQNEKALTANAFAVWLWGKKFPETKNIRDWERFVEPFFESQAVAGQVIVEVGDEVKPNTWYFGTTIRMERFLDSEEFPVERRQLVRSKMLGGGWYDTNGRDVEAKGPFVGPVTEEALRAAQQPQAPAVEVPGMDMEALIAVLVKPPKEAWVTVYDDDVDGEVKVISTEKWAHVILSLLTSHQGDR